VLVNEFLGDMAVLQRRLYTDAIGHRAPGEPHELPEVMDTYLLLQVWDRLSLQFALRHGADGEIGPLPLSGAGSAGSRARGRLRCHARGRFELALDPYPFAEDRVELPLLASAVADRRYGDPEDFLSTLASAGQTVLECTAVRE
jgi:hypothetical protein